MEQLEKIKASVLEGMLDYMADGGADYERKDVERVGEIMDEHLAALSGAGDRDAALACVRDTVEKLNALNKACGEELIETDQREGICEFIITAGAQRGFNDEGDDVTEEWRDW